MTGSTPESKSDRPEKSYLSAAVESISPWGGSRSSTPKPIPAAIPGEASGLKNQKGGDHSTHLWQGQSRKTYPTDCPELVVKWYYAVDIPKRKPKLLKTNQENIKPLPAPKKFITFSSHDSQSIEAAYQTLAEEYDSSNEKQGKDDFDDGETSPSAGQDDNSRGKVRVPVHEDFLFDVDIERRELLPAYWLGPIYEVRRGSWFYQEGSILKPCDENLATQLEEGYLKVKPFRYFTAPEKASSPTSMKSNDPKSPALIGASTSADITPRASMENLRVAKQQLLNDPGMGSKDSSISSPQQPQTHRLFGSHMNSIVTYQDSTVAWLSGDDIMSRVSSTMYEKFAGGGYLGGVKIVRGYSESGKVKDANPGDKGPPTPTVAATNPGIPPELHLDERQQRLLKRRSAPPITPSPLSLDGQVASERGESIRQLLQSEQDPEKDAEATRQRDEKEIQNDYKDRDGENQGREIEHLILVTHGIGQRLGMRTETINFVHDVNVLRQTLKSVYVNSADLQALNSEIDKLPKNCRIQVLPVCWRHLLDFPRKGVRQNRREHDLGEAFDEEEDYPSLEDITVEGVPFVRSLISDLALDILLYQSAYREHISVIVLKESNRIYNLFHERNPSFKGRVSLIGHSLGSAVLFDLLCRQKEDTSGPSSFAHQRHSKNQRSATTKTEGKDLSFDFDVEDFYCLGSPVGLFQMLKGRTIAARHQPEAVPAESPMDPDYMGIDDPFLGPSNSNSGLPTGVNVSITTGLPFTISSPKCAQLYNIFHPTDPISYRLEPLIAPAMASMKPQALPYTKKGIFGATASVSGIGAKVGQSVSGLWSSLSSGIASSLLNRSLGLTNDDVARVEAVSSGQSLNPSQSIGAGINISTDGVISDIPSPHRDIANEKKRQLAEDTATADRDNAIAPTLIGEEIETLYAGFQKRREGHQHDNDIGQDRFDVEERAKKLRKEDMKVRALNQNGRVDFSIQESVLDFNPINTIASHLSYWADEDVSHFMMSQLLSRHRSVPHREKGITKNIVKK